MRKFCLADKTVNSFVIAVYMPMMCWRNGVLVNWKNDDLFSNLNFFDDPTEFILDIFAEFIKLTTPLVADSKLDSVDSCKLI